MWLATTTDIPLPNWVQLPFWVLAVIALARGWVVLGRELKKAEQVCKQEREDRLQERADRIKAEERLERAIAMVQETNRTGTEILKAVERLDRDRK